MNEDYDYDDYEDDDSLSPELAAQLARLERSHPLRGRDAARRQRHTVRVRRQLEDWKDTRRMRDEIDYLR